MLLFLHMHKCAGTTIRLSAERSGLRLPVRHRNGNLLGPEGRNLRYAELPEDEVRALLRAQRDAGVGFVAMEADFPPLAAIPRRRVRLFTVLRDPFERAVSHFRFAKRRGRVPPFTTFRDFLAEGRGRDGPLSRSPDYYVRKLTASGASDPLSRRHLRAAGAVLEGFADVIILGRDDLATRLRRLGMAEMVVGNVTDAVLVKVVVPPAALEVPDEDRAWFEARNALDRALFAAWKARPSNGADASPGS